MEENKDADSIPNFCTRHDISRSALYKAWAEGRGPRRMIVGDKILISRESGKEWRQQCERDAENAPPPRPRGRNIQP